MKMTSKKPTTKSDLMAPIIYWMAGQSDEVLKQLVLDVNTRDGAVLKNALEAAEALTYENQHLWRMLRNEK
jgi:hypothetical protein